MATTSATQPPPPPAASGWACLPCDILLDVFLRVGHRDVLQSAGLVCAAWWRVARNEPSLWRLIDLTLPDDAADLCDSYLPYWLFDEDASTGWMGMARAAVRRSAGQCEAFCGRGDDDLLLYLPDRAQSLKSIRITSHHDVSSNVFVTLVKRLPLLEELELVLNLEYCEGIHRCNEQPISCWAELLLASCETCSHLKWFTVRRAGSNYTTIGPYYRRVSNYLEAFKCPTMHGLVSLQLFGNSFTEDVLLSIVDACPNLQSLDVSEVKLDRWDQRLRVKCSKIKNVRLPFPSFYIEDSDEEGDEESNDNYSDDFDFGGVFEADFDDGSVHYYWSSGFDSDEGECYFGDLFEELS